MLIFGGRSWKTRGQSKHIQIFYVIACIQILFNALLFWSIIFSANALTSKTKYEFKTCFEHYIRLFLTLIPSILMIVTYYTLFLLLFDNMLTSRVDSSASYRKRLGNFQVSHFCSSLDTNNCLVKTLRAAGFFLIFGVVALNIVYMIMASTN